MLKAIVWRFSVLLIVTVVALFVGLPLSVVLLATSALALGFATSLFISIENGVFERKPNDDQPSPIKSESEAR